MPKRKNRKAKRTSFSFTDEAGESRRLTLKQKLFAEKFVELRGNATQAAKSAGYRAKNDNVFASIGSENLTNPKILDYVRILLRGAGFSDEAVDRELLSVIQQSGDLPAKMRGIAEYNKIRGRHAAEKHEVKSKEERIVKIIDYSKVEID